MLPRDTWQGYELHPIVGPHPKRHYKKTILPTVYTRLENPWVDLHNGTVCDAESFAKWELKIPRYGCQCRKDYEVYKAANPPDFSSPEALWLWGFHLHNWVNRKLGKTELTIEEATKLWRGTNGLDSNEEEPERNLD